MVWIRIFVSHRPSHGVVGQLISLARTSLHRRILSTRTGWGAIVQRNVNVTKNSAGNFVTIDPRFSSFSLYQNLGWIKYNALLTRVAYRTKPASFGISYTLGHTTSDTTTAGVGGEAVITPLSLTVNAGPADEG